MRHVLIALLCVLPLGGCKTPGGHTPVQKRRNIDEVAASTLKELYENSPDLRTIVQSAPGYGVFARRGIKIFFAGTGNGYGVVVDSSNDKRTYMRMGGLDVGPGLGVKDFRAVFVFHDRQSLNRFVERGWEFGGQAEAVAKAGDAGGAATAEGTVSGISVYRVTDSGVALQATLGGTKYWKDPELN